MIRAGRNGNHLVPVNRERRGDSPGKGEREIEASPQKTTTERGVGVEDIKEEIGPIQSQEGRWLPKNIIP